MSEQHPKRRPSTPAPSEQERQQQRKLLRLSVQQEDQDNVAADVVPPVTVVLDGRCICHRVHLSRHSGYGGLAGALRRLFVDTDDIGTADDDDHGLDLSNAVPGHIVAYEDMEDDLLLAGDLNWKYVIHTL
ncbi:hypothetical protein ABZP36_008253 [Zizania latifolia]